MDKSKTFDSYVKAKNIEQHPKKTDQILELFDEIELAIKNGASITHLWMWLQEYHDIEISKSYFNTILYRLRKSKGLTQKRTLPPQPQNTTSDSSPVPSKTDHDYQGRYDDLMLRYKSAKTYEEKYTILGGDPQKLDGHTPRKQREMCIELQMKTHNQYKPFIKL